MGDAEWCEHGEEAQGWGGKAHSSDVGQLRAPCAPVPSSCWTPQTQAALKDRQIL